MTRCASLLTASLFAALMAGSAQATIHVDPDVGNASASYIISGDVNDVPFSAVDSFYPVYNGTSWVPYTAVTQITGPVGVGSGTVELYPTPEVSASTGPLLNADPKKANDTLVLVAMSYYMGIAYSGSFPPSFTEKIPVFYDVAYGLSGSNGSSTQVNVVVGGGQVIQANCANDACNGAKELFAGSFEGKVGSIREITLGAGASTTLGQSPGFAWVDPYFYIDPTWLAANPGYSIVVTAGMGNFAPGAGVPEPGSWALMIVGLAGLGCAVRRGRMAACAAGLDG